MNKKAKDFYVALAADNTKDWGLENKAIYDADLKAPALALIDEMAPKLSEMCGEPVTGKLFRPHRDVRFSKDKRPYKEHLHMLWQVQAGGKQDPVFFFGIAPDYTTVGTGLMGFDKAVLADWRKFVDLDADRIGKIFDDAARAGYVMRDPALKRVPSPYPADHPNAVLLRQKGCVVSGDLPDGDVTDALMRGFKDLKPINDLLVSVVCA